MGRPKSELSLAGTSLVERAASALHDLSDQIFVVGRNGGNHQYVTLEDADERYAQKGRSAMIGLYTAFANCRAPHAALLACDLPFVTSELFNCLAEISLASTESDAMVPMQPDGRLQPLCAIYRPAGCLPTIRAALDTGDLRLQETVARLKIRNVEFSEIMHLNGADNFFFNLNTPADYAAAEESAKQSP